MRERFPADLERIRDYLRMPSVSATGEGIREVAEATAAWIGAAGGSAELVETGGHPLVMGELPGPAGSPRLFRYGMYDVQPAEEPDWTSPPFAAEVRDLPGIGEAVICRGSANSKGCLGAFFVAVEILRELNAMPVTVVMAIEGEEELGSPNLEAALRSRLDDVRAEAAFDLDLTADTAGTPELITGCKGLASLELRVAGGAWGGPEIPLHSSEMAWIASPAWDLARALASLVDAGQDLAVDGLEADVRPPTEDDELMLKELAAAFDPAGHLREVRASRYRLEGSAEDLLRALLFRPTLNVDGIEAGYTGPGGKTIIPAEGRAVLDVRLVPDMRPGPVAEAIRRHLDARGLGHVEVLALESYPWAKAPMSNPVARAMEASYRTLGLPHLPYPLAPWCAPYFVFDRVLGIPWASGGAGHAAGAHGPDEYATLEGLRQHVEHAAAFLLAYAAGRDGAATERTGPSAATGPSGATEGTG